MARKQEKLSDEELDAQNGEELPDREVMSIVPVGPDPLLIDPADQPVGTDPTLDESGTENPTDQSSGAGS